MKKVIELVDKILMHEADAIRAIPNTFDFEVALILIHEAVHVRKGKLVTSGMGKAGQIANNIATTFSSTGTPAVFLHPSEAQHGDLGVIQKEDILLVISNSGITREIFELVELANNLFNRPMPFILITGNKDAPLAKKAKACILTGNPLEVCPLGLTPTTSTTAMTVIGDILVTGMMEKLGFTYYEYHKRHHDGYLGSLSKNK